MRFFPLILAALPLVAPFVAAAPSVAGMAARADSAAYCTASTQCGDQSKYFCNHNYCAEKAATGGACYKDVGCYSSFCDGGKCAVKAEGVACSASSQCATGNCMYSKCAAKQADGAACYKE